MTSSSADRPWGSWHVLDEGVGYKVKRIEVAPHRRLSYQTHSHRSEHWVVISGTATCVVNGETVTVRQGETLSVNVGDAHRIGNEQDDRLVVIEIQRGSYTGEDDILRLADDYGRTETSDETNSSNA
jgi:mannose-6-phosphate isomerase